MPRIMYVVDFPEPLIQQLEEHAERISGGNVGWSEALEATVEGMMRETFPDHQPRVRHEALLDDEEPVVLSKEERKSVLLWIEERANNADKRAKDFERFDKEYREFWNKRVEFWDGLYDAMALKQKGS